MKARLIWLLVAAIVVNVATVAVWKVRTRRRVVVQGTENRGSGLQWGDPAPRFKFSSIAGQVIDSDSLRGNTVLLDFFDPEDEHHWARILYADMLARRYAEDGLRAVAISEGRTSRLDEIAKNLTIPLVCDEGYSAADLFGLGRCCGGTVVIDAQGVVRFITSHIADEDVIRAVLESLLEQDSTSTRSKSEGRT